MLASSLSPVLHQSHTFDFTVLWIIAGGVAVGLIALWAVSWFLGSDYLHDLARYLGWAFVAALCVLFISTIAVTQHGLDVQQDNLNSRTASWLRADYGINVSATTAHSLLDGQQLVVTIHGKPSTIELVSTGGKHVVPVDESTKVPLTSK